MATVLDYLNWRGDLLFSSDPFNEVDGLIFSRFSYLALEQLVPEEFTQWTTVKDIADKATFPPEDIPNYVRASDIELLYAMAKAPRFQNLRVSGFHHLLDDEKTEQFAGVILELEENLAFLSYRGTDETLTGWKESVSLGFLSPVPSQRDAVDYLNAAVGALPRYDFILGGHSKGGNLAMYAAVFSDPALAERIVQVYNYDGPGFTKETVEKGDGNFQVMRDKIFTFVPEFSVVGMLLDHQENYTVIKSTQDNWIQHNIYFWQVVGPTMERASDRSDTSYFVDRTLKDWLEDMSLEQRQAFVNGVFQLLSDANITKVSDITNNWYDTIRSTYKAYSQLDEDTWTTVSKGLKLFVSLAQKNIPNFLPQNPFASRKELSQATETTEDTTDPTDTKPNNLQ